MDEKKYTLDDIETLRSKTGVGYEEAVALLEKYDGDIARALVELEKRGRLNRDGFLSSANRDKAEDFLSRCWHVGCETRIIVERKGEKLIDLSALLGWKLIVASAVLALILSCHLRVRLPETLKKAEPEAEKAESEAEKPEPDEDKDKKDDQDGYHTITIE